MAALLRERLLALNYTVEGVTARIGEHAMAALGRNETTPGRLALGDAGAPGDVPIRLFCLRDEVLRAEVQRAFGEQPARALIDDGILASAGAAPDDPVRCILDLHPYGDESHDWWVLSDPVPGMDGRPPRLADDHVLGVNEAATTLAGLTVRDPVHRALDLGCGSGIQALHLSSHVTGVVGTDVLPRALAMARWSALLNGLQSVEWREGSLLEPVSDEQFDLIVSNPPFVVSPDAAGWGEGAHTVLTYRDSLTEGDAMVAGLIQNLPRHLKPGGTAQLLANWAHLRGQDWRERVSSWIPEGIDAWVVQREVLDPSSYVEVWLADAGLRGTPGYVKRYDAWLRWMEAGGIESVGMGWVTLRYPVEPVGPTVLLEELTGPVTQPMSPAVQRFLDGAFATGGTSVADLRLIAAPELVQEQWSTPGAADPEHLVLRQQGLAGRAVEVDAALAGFVGACDGELPAGRLAAAVAELLDVPDDSRVSFVADLLVRARRLVHEGVLLVANDDGDRTDGR